MQVRVKVKNQVDVNLPFRKQYKARLSFLEAKYKWKTTTLACEASNAHTDLVPRGLFVSGDYEEETKEVGGKLYPPKIKSYMVSWLSSQEINIATDSLVSSSAL